MTFRRGIVGLAMLGACTDVCSFEDQVGTFLVEHPDAINCRFAHSFSWDGGVVGVDVVHDCILDAIARSKSFVGGYLTYGIDGGTSTAFLGEATPRGFAFSYVLENPSAYHPTVIYRTPCDDIVDAPVTPYNIGIECIGAELVETCSL